MGKTSPKPVEIISLNKEDKKLVRTKGLLEKILETDELKDRYVAIISIAGLPRQGKSYMLNFFLKYLYAEVMALQFNRKFFVIFSSFWFCVHSTVSTTQQSGWKVE